MSANINQSHDTIQTQPPPNLCRQERQEWTERSAKRTEIFARAAANYTNNRSKADALSKNGGPLVKLLARSERRVAGQEATPPENANVQSGFAEWKQRATAERAAQAASANGTAAGNSIGAGTNNTAGSDTAAALRDAAAAVVAAAAAITRIADVLETAAGNVTRAAAEEVDEDETEEEVDGDEPEEEADDHDDVEIEEEVDDDDENEEEVDDNEAEEEE